MTPQERTYARNLATDALERFIIWMFEEGYDPRDSLRENVVDSAYALVGEFLRTHPREGRQ